MSWQFKSQKFQTDATRAVCDVFTGQPLQSLTYQMDRGEQQRSRLADDFFFTGYSNAPLAISDAVILENINKIQRENQLAPSRSIESQGSPARYNITIEMETGVGKTYTYIKTMLELNIKYGWSKFIIVVPSVAIREGVYKTFQITREHFMQEYQDAPCRTIDFFIYNSMNLTQIDDFANSSGIKAMIINAQAFNSKKDDARRIFKNLDDFRSRKPIDIIKQTNPILIIDEPQSVEGESTKEQLSLFNPLFIIRYSATHRADSVYNLVYRLDAMDAYNKRLVKKIAVKGISVSGSTGTEGYLYLESINLSANKPTATIEFDIKTKTGIKKVRRIVEQGFRLYDKSGELPAYESGFTVVGIDGRDNSIELSNGKKLFAGDMIGAADALQIRRVQIRETILTHLERERHLFSKGIKVLSLFFIDEVKSYRVYEGEEKRNGIYADMFEQEYNAIVSEYLPTSEYSRWLLDGKTAKHAHNGYFSVDKNNRFIDGRIDKTERMSDDVSAYDLIMKDKERLLSYAEPVRFIFSHSALREGWDNPNVFQICTLKDGKSEVRKRQEIGRGLRLSVNQELQRQDVSVLGESVHDVNVLTVIASESYDSFAKDLQIKMAEAVAYRPTRIDNSLFVGKVISVDNNKQIIDNDQALAIYESLIENGYVKRAQLTDKYYADRTSGSLAFSEEFDCADSIVQILDNIYNPSAIKPENARENNVELEVRQNLLDSKEFKALWENINSKSFYVVDFSSDELVQNAAAAINSRLRVSRVRIRIEQGELGQIESKEQLLQGDAFTKQQIRDDVSVQANDEVKYDIVGCLADDTRLLRRDVAKILNRVDREVMALFAVNPEEFLIRAAEIIRDELATVIVKHIRYNKREEKYDTSMFTQPSIKGKLGYNVISASRHLYNYVKYDSEVEKEFAQQLELHTSEVAVYVKLPDGFYISTPVGRYNPDWAIAFYEGTVKHVFFVAETKGSMKEMSLRQVELAKEYCAQQHFKAISADNVKFKIISNYADLLSLITN